MTTKQITQPAELAVSMEAARTAARVDGPALDSEIIMVVKSATARAEHITGRAFIQRQYRVSLDAFPAAVKLEYPPIVSVESVRFLDADRVMQTLDPQDYDVDLVSEPGWVVPADGRAWPTSATHINAVSVDYTSGYGLTEASVPDCVKEFILASVQAHFFPGAIKSEDLECLLDPVKVYA